MWVEHHVLVHINRSHSVAAVYLSLSSNRLSDVICLFTSCFLWQNVGTHWFALFISVTFSNYWAPNGSDGQEFAYYIIGIYKGFYDALRTMQTWLYMLQNNLGDPGSIPGSGWSPGEGGGNPLQYSCLENSMDSGTWWAAVHGVAKSWTRLSN